MSKAPDLSVIWPMQTCPICGKQFLATKEWGCVIPTRNSNTRRHTTYIKVCSIPCMRKDEQRIIEMDAKHAATLRCVKTYKLSRVDGLSEKEIMNILGHKVKEYVARDIQFAEDMYWQEIEWLNKHNWEVEK